jgi:hypothetical protein
VPDAGLPNRWRCAGTSEDSCGNKQSARQCRSDAGLMVNPVDDRADLRGDVVWQRFHRMLGKAPLGLVLGRLLVGR